MSNSIRPTGGKDGRTMGTIGVLTSGGDSPGMNAAIRAVVRSAISKGYKAMGIRRGFEGLIHGELEDMGLSSVADIIHRGGTILKTVRSEEFTTEKGKSKALNVIRVFGIEGLVVIGGNGSFRGAEDLNQLGVPTIGVPGTIDNDLAYTDYTIGFDTAMNTVVEAISRIRDTSASHGRANIIEVMGRHCGDIALYSGLAGGAESIIIPEIGLDIDKVCKKLLNGKNRGKLHSIIVLAEGAGGAIELCNIIEERTGIETRATILGHIQRGGNPTAFDRVLASKMGAKAVDLLIDKKENLAVGVKGNEIYSMDFAEALKMEKKIDKNIYQLVDVLSI